MAMYNANPPEYIDGILARRCYMCRSVKMFSEFPKDRLKKHGRGSACNPCNKERSRAWNIANPKKAKVMKRSWYLKQQTLRPFVKRQLAWRQKGINITPEQYLIKLAEQNSCCKICRRPEKVFKKSFAPDHDHKTGIIRGLLCGPCNPALGYFQDDQDRILRAINYLKASELCAK